VKCLVHQRSQLELDMAMNRQSVCDSSRTAVMCSRVMQQTIQQYYCLTTLVADSKTAVIRSSE